MTQEEKQILLKDLSARLSYGVKMNHIAENEHSPKTLIGIAKDMITLQDTGGYEYVDVEHYKPYLFPLSSMTDELWDKEFRGLGITEFTLNSFKYGCETLELDNSGTDLSNIVIFINQLIKNHFDIYGLIEKGIAIDCTNLNIY